MFSNVMMYVTCRDMFIIFQHVFIPCGEGLEWDVGTWTMDRSKRGAESGGVTCGVAEDAIALCVDLLGWMCSWSLAGVAWVWNFCIVSSKEDGMRDDTSIPDRVGSTSIS